MTAQLDGIDSAQPSTPTPSAIYAQYFPAHVVLPDGSARSSVRVFVTDVGLYVFDAKPEDGSNPTGSYFFSPMDWPATLEGQPRLPQPRVAFALKTEAGDVRVTQQLGCGCHLRSLKNWVPPWIGRSLPWGETGA